MKVLSPLALAVLCMASDPVMAGSHPMGGSDDIIASIRRTGTDAGNPRNAGLVVDGVGSIFGVNSRTSVLEMVGTYAD
jgi:hypothetical protein